MLWIAIASAIDNRAKHAWAKAGLHPITLHECRHSYAAYMIAAGINTNALTTYMGHASITITLDCYGHLLPGNEHHAATLLNNWLLFETSEQAESPGKLASKWINDEHFSTVIPSAPTITSGKVVARSGNGVTVVS